MFQILGKSKKSTGPVVHDTEFVVGKVAEKNELKELLAPLDSTPPKGKTTTTKGMLYMYTVHTALLSQLLIHMSLAYLQTALLF